MFLHPCWFFSVNCFHCSCLLCHVCPNSSSNVSLESKYAMYNVQGDSRDETATINGSVLLSTWNRVEGKKDPVAWTMSHVVWCMSCLACWVWQRQTGPSGRERENSSCTWWLYSLEFVSSTSADIGRAQTALLGNLFTSYYRTHLCQQLPWRRTNCSLTSAVITLYKLEGGNITTEKPLAYLLISGLVIFS